MSEAILGALHRLLLRMDAEAAHDLAIRGLRLSQRSKILQRLVEGPREVSDPRLAQRLWGRDFANPLGLAAGFDKNAEVVKALAGMGFGFLEVGTVTRLPQRGNPRPRLFRHPAQQSLQNALGFNNAGVERMREQLRRLGPAPIPVGINIGKNRETPTRDALGDYEMLVDRLADFADYFVINVSSPNTPGLRELQRGETLIELLRACRQRTDRPLLVKLAPDIEDGRVIDLAEASVGGGAAGIVITNTTIDYSLIPGIEPRGGLSGRVLQRRSFEILRLLAARLAGRCTLISVGGVDSAQQIYARLRAGADLVQVYTAMILQGPLVIRRWLRELVELMDRDGVDQIGDLVGVDMRPRPSQREESGGG